MICSSLQEAGCITTTGIVKSKKGVFEVAPPSSSKNVLLLLQVELTSLMNLWSKSLVRKLSRQGAGYFGLPFYPWPKRVKILCLSVPVASFWTKANSPFMSAQKTSIALSPQIKAMKGQAQRLNIVPPKEMPSPNSWKLRLWPCLETGSSKIQLC